MGYSKVPIDGRINLRRYRRKLSKYTMSAKNFVFPMQTSWLVYLTLMITILHLSGVFVFGQSIVTLQTTFDDYFGHSHWNKIISIALVSFVFCYFLVIIARFAFTLLLYYNGWLYESAGSRKISLPTKLFMLIIKLVNRHATFFSFNDLLPWLPVPSLNVTLTKYLRSVRPLMNDEEYNETVRLAEEFRSTIGPSLQRKLWLKWFTSKNYVSDWWKEVIYMRYRNSLIYTNVASADVIYQKTSSIQAARAANVISCIRGYFRDIFTKQTMKPITLGGIPICAQQYLDYYRTIRIPCETSDKMVRLPETARHIVVYCKGCWYRLPVYHGRRLLTPAELERCFQAIIDRTPDPDKGEKYFSALTAGPRDLWAKIRNNHFSNGINHESLSTIENALDILFLDDEERFYDENDTTKYDLEYGRSLHGHGYQLWCDRASFHVSKNGRFTCNSEHSAVDALIYVHMREYVKYHEQFTYDYMPDGHAKGDVEVVPTAERIRWQFNQETLDAIDESYKVAKGVADDFDNANEVFLEFGKNFMKTIGVSPDAFMQMALQMAYYLDQGKFELTYEPTMTRMFKEGRTETVRSCTIESCDFVRSMLDESASDDDRYRLLKIACDMHQSNYRASMTGAGFDRHLFALYIVAKYLHISSAFLDRVFSMSFALSTSQTPQHQQTEIMNVLNKSKEYFWPAGAFSCPEGSNYGVCYTIGATGDMLSYHVATWKSIKHTNASRFRDRITQSLKSIKMMCDRRIAANK